MELTLLEKMANLSPRSAFIPLIDSFEMDLNGGL